MDTANENLSSAKPTGLRQPTTFNPFTSTTRALGELNESGMNARSMSQQAAATKHKMSGCNIPVSIQSVSGRPLTLSVPEPITKRPTLAERAGEVPNRKLAAPATSRPVNNGVKNTIGRGLAASTSRATSNTTNRHPSAPTFGASVGAASKMQSTYGRPKSSYGQYPGHGRSKSQHQMRSGGPIRRDEDAEPEEPERKGVVPFHISTDPNESLKVSKRRQYASAIPKKEKFHISNPRSISSPSVLQDVSPIQKENGNAGYDDICNSVKKLNLGNSKAEKRGDQAGRGSKSGRETDVFLKPVNFHSQLPQPTPTPVRQQYMSQPTPRPPSTTPGKQRRFLNKWSNDLCPDFYDHRIELMEREFRSFKEKIEDDVRQATDYKESIRQLQSRVTELETIRARLEVVNKGLESELDDTRSYVKTIKMEMEMNQQKHSFEVDDLRRKLRNEVDDVESRYRKDADRAQREREDEEAKFRKDYEVRIDRLLKDHTVELAELRKKVDADSEAERSRQTQEAQKIETEYASKLRMASLEAGAKQREAQLLNGEITNVKAELDRERSLRTGLQTQLTDATTNNLTLNASNKAMKEKIDFLESDSQAQSQAFNDLHRRMQEAIEAAELAHEKLRQEETLRRKLFNQVQELKGNIRVMCRVRPAHESETDPAQISFPDVDTDSKEVSVLGPNKQSAMGKDTTTAYAYSFDRVFGPGSQNGEVFEEISQLVQSALDGYNVCIFCYGQTGAGKTYTMSSADGMIPRATAQIWDEAQRLQEKGWRYAMEGSFIEVYNETYNDLLGRSEDLDKKKVEVRHDAAKKQTNLENVVSVMLDGPKRVDEILATASKNRTVAATKANMRSSRSHSVFILKLVGTNDITGERSEGTLNLVDLAGSERLEHSKAEGARLKETQNINKSLSCLGDVINALGSAKEGSHIPYRNSKLTYLLQYSLGGNSKTLMFVMVSPLQAHLQETVTSLKFATKVHNTHIGTAKKQTRTAST